jgi:hypothetical protein
VKERKTIGNGGKDSKPQLQSIQETYRRRLWIFCRLRSSATVPPWVLKRSVKLVTAVNTPNIAVTTASMLRSMWYEFRTIYEIKKQRSAVPSHFVPVILMCWAEEKGNIVDLGSSPLPRSFALLRVSLELFFSVPM